MSKQQDDRDKLWNSMYKQLLVFKGEYGHTRVPATYDKSLAKWVSRQRENETSMVPARKKKLHTIRFAWHSDILLLDEQAWLSWYEQLKLFYKKHRHFQIPSANEQYTSLRIWVDKQRALEDKMSSHRKLLLNQIKFRWGSKIKAELNTHWNLMYSELTQFYKVNKHCRVSSHSKEFPELGQWVTRQRKSWKELDTRKRKKLTALNFSTSDEIDKEKRKKWLTMFSKLKRYKAEHKHCRVPSKYEKNPELGRWVEVQRLEEKKLTDWKKDHLNSLGFEWSRDIQVKNEKRWYAMYSKLENFYKRFGHSSVPEYWKEDPKLAIWVTYQRRPKLPLAPEKIRLLKDLSFEWVPKAGRPRKRSIRGQYVTEI